MSSLFKPKVEVFDYHMSIHYMVCQGPVDSVEVIYIDNKEVSGTYSDQNQDIEIEDKGFFGGDKNGGGISGKISYLLGGGDQFVPAWYAEKRGTVPGDTPAYRGVLSLIFSGKTGGPDGFKWRTNIPSVPAVSVTVKRSPKGLAGDDPWVGVDANPAHILYEVLLRAGRYPAAQIDSVSFTEAAQTLRDENFGMSFRVDNFASEEEIVDYILGHIDGVLSFDPVSETIGLTLLRDTTGLTPVAFITEDNSDLIAYDPGGLRDRVPGVTVSWTNPATEETETVSRVNPVLFDEGIHETEYASFEYPGVRTQDLALRLAERQLRAVTAPLVTMEVSISDEVPPLRIGDVVHVLWNEMAETNFGLSFRARVVSINAEPRPASGRTVGLLQDIFSLQTGVIAVQDSTASPTSSTPVDVSKFLLTGTPYYLFAAGEGETAAQAVTSPVERLMVLADRENLDTAYLSLWAETTLPEVGQIFVETGDTSSFETFSLGVALVPQETSAIGLALGKNVAVGDLLILEGPSTHEIVSVSGLNSGVLTVRRGVLDTVPGSHTSSTRVWIIPRGLDTYEDVDRSSGEDVILRMLPVTSSGQLALESATPRTVTMPSRLTAPYRPASVSVDGAPGFAFTKGVADVLSLTWSNRNRIQETATILSWFDGDVPGEPGQSTYVRVEKEGVVLHTETGITGQQKNLDLGSLSIDIGDELVIYFGASVGGLNSFQEAEILLTIQ